MFQYFIGLFIIIGVLFFSVDLSAVDKFNATPWDYAKNRQLHYCQLIIMSHQRQRLVSNPASPIPSGLGLMLNGFGGSFTNGDFGSSIDFDGMVCITLLELILKCIVCISLFKII